jgi:cytochrome c oxidase assembly factor CtaG
MQPTGQAVLLSWSIPPAASLALALTALLYLRGWILLRHAGLPFLPIWRVASFLLGLFSVWVALASPLDTFSGFVLTAHMLQHMMLMMVAPPLILLGSPLVPLVRGLPIFAAREFAGPFLNWRLSNRVGRALTHPIVALVLMGMAMFAWHTPRLYELALSSGSWHEFEHACFFLASLIFWWPVVQPWPSRPQWQRWAMVPYLLIADLQNTALSAILVFSDRVIYPSYAAVPRLFGFSALQDQAAAGAIMWVVGSFAFVVPAIIIAVQSLSRVRSRVETPSAHTQPAPFLKRVFAISQRLSFAGRFLRRLFGVKAVEAISFLLLFAVAGLCIARLASAGSDDDDQTLRLSEHSGPFAVSVFAQPSDLEAGPASFNVLVQDRDTLQIVPDATVTLYAQESSGSRQTSAVQAKQDESENKLLRSGTVDFPSEGSWRLIVTIQRDGQHTELILPLRVVQPDSGVSIPWPYIVLLAFAAILAFVYVCRRRSQRRLHLTHPVQSAAREDSPAKLY